MRRKKLKNRISAYLLLFAMVLSLLNTAVVVNGNGTANAASVEVRPVGAEDGSTYIEGFRYGFDSGYDEIVDSDTGLWHATMDDAGHAFIFNVDYSYRGIRDVPFGTIEIRIPLNIIKKKDGAWGDFVDIPFPPNTPENLAKDPEYVYEIRDLDTDHPYVAILNNKVNEASSAGSRSFEVSYVLEKETFEYLDMYKSEGFEPEIWIRDPATGVATRYTNEETVQTGELYVQIDTQVKINSTKKTIFNNRIYDSWNAEWGEKPADADDYAYLVWEIESDVNKFLSQKYNFWIEDVPDTEEVEVIKYKMQGCGTGWYDEETIQANSNLHNLTNTGVRYDYILTRHPKSLFDDLLVNEGDSYTVRNTATAVVTPVDGKDDPSTATDHDAFTRTKRPFTPPIGTVSPHKKGLTTSYQLSDFRDGYDTKNQPVDAIADLQYQITSDTYGYTWTIADNADPNDPAAYGQKNIHYTLTDDAISLVGERLVAGDYRFDNVQFDVSVQGATFNATDNRFFAASPTYTDTNKLLSLQIKRDSWDDYKTVAVYDLQTKTFVSYNQDEISSVDSSARSVVFQNDSSDGVAAYRFVSDNNFYSMQLNTKPSLSLRRNGHTLAIVEELQSADLDNTVTMQVKRDESDEEPVFERSHTGTDHIYPETRDSLVNKEVTTSHNRVLEQHFVISWHAWMRETIQVTTVEPVTQDSGTFYDLLPDGNEVDLDSIFVEADGKILPASSLEVTVTPNYKNSNRTLLAVRVKDPADVYDLYFDTIYTWDGIHDYGRVVYNPIAYETGNVTIAKGQADNGGVGKVVYTRNKFFSDLDPSTTAEDRKFIYNEHQYDAYVVTSAATGLDKKIRDKAGSTYSYATVSGAGESYMYQLRFANGNITKAKNIILYDNIEEYTPIIDGEPMPRDWRGTLTGIDISYAVRSGILPRVYYSTAEGGLDFTYSAEDAGNTDVSNSAVWTEIPIDYSLSDSPEDQISAYLAAYTGDRITSVAIDFSRSLKDEFYVLDKGATLFAILYMKAPEKTEQGLAEWTSETHSTQYPMTYNDVYVKTTVINEYEQEETYVYEQAYTSAGFHITGDVKLHKYNSDAPDESVPDIRFRLYGTSSYGTPVDVYATTDRYGNLSFSGIELGTYTLQEVSTITTNPDWMPDHTAHTVKVGVAEITVDGVNLGAGSYQVGNSPRAHADVQFTKHEYGNKFVPIEGVVFRLSGTSVYGNDILMVETSTVFDEEKENAGEIQYLGVVTFENLEAGTYTMREVEVPDGYIRSKAEYTIIVDENGNYSITSSDKSVTQERNGDYYISNEKYTDVVFYKISSTTDGTADYLNGVKFRLRGTSYSGTDVDMEVLSDDSLGNGTVRFSGLEPGSYILTEEELPDDTEHEYVKDDASRIVTVSRTGEVTIDGMSSDTQGLYHLYNPRKGKDIIVVKNWVDDLTDRSGLNPLIAVTTESPELSFKTAVFKKASWNTFFDKSFPRTSIRHFTRMSMSEMKAHIEDGTAKNIKNTEKNQNSPNYSELDVWGWYDESTATFYWASDANTVKLSSDTESMFWASNGSNCNFYTIDLRGIDTSLVKNLKGFFQGNNYLDAILGTIDASSATSLENLFSRCFRMTSAPTIINTQNVTSLKDMFYCVYYLSYLDLSTMDTSKVTTTEEMFRMDGYNDETGKRFVCRLKNINFSSFDTANVTNMKEMFENCASLETLDLSTFNVEKLENAEGMFTGIGAPTMTYLDVSSFKTTSLTNTKQMFYRMTVSTIYVSEEFTVANVTNDDQMFYWSDNLVGGAGTKNPTAHNSNPKSWYNKDWANIDSAEDPGYFTYREYHPKTPVVRKTSASSSGDVTPGSYGDSTVLSSDTSSCVIVRDDANNRWVYTFRVGEGTSYVWEAVVPDGYVSDYDGSALEKFIKVTESGDRTAVITNTKEQIDELPTYGNISITKTVRNQEYTVLNSWPSSYHFTVTLTDKDDNPISGLLNCDGTIFTDGVCTISLSDSHQAQIINHIPSGYHYTVTETEGDANTLIAHNGVVSTAYTASGVIAADTKEDVAFTNTVIEDRRSTADVKVKKLVTGGTIEGAEFTFYADLTNLKINTDYRIEKEDGTLLKSFTSDEYGNGFVSFTLKHNETAVLKGLPYADEHFKGATYLINEAHSKGFIPSYVVSDANNGKNIVRAHDESSLNTALTTARETVDQGEDITVTYSNAIVQTRDLVLEKKLDSPFADNRKFSFTVHFTDLGPDTAYYISGVGRIVADNEGKASLDVQLAPGDRITFRDLPVGCTYTVTENADSTANVQRYVASYQIATNGVGSVLSAAKSANGYGEKLSTDVETIDPGEDNTVTFTNVLTRLTVSKTVTGNMGDRTKAFTFKVLFRKADGTPLADTALRCLDQNKDESTIVTDADGYAVFTLAHTESLTLTGMPPDTTFEVVEDENSVRGYTVDIVDDSGSNYKDGKGVITVAASHVDVTNDRTVLITTGVDIRGIIVTAVAAALLYVLMMLCVKRRREAHHE